MAITPPNLIGILPESWLFAVVISAVNFRFSSQSGRYLIIHENWMNPDWIEEKKPNVKWINVWLLKTGWLFSYLAYSMCHLP